MGVANDLFSERVRAGKRTYFLDVKENSRKDKYLVITESKKDNEDYKRASLRIYEEDLGKFEVALKSVLEYIKDTNNGNGNGNGGHSEE